MKKIFSFTVQAILCTSHCLLWHSQQTPEVAKRLIFPWSQREQVGATGLIAMFSASKSHAFVTVTVPPGSPSVTVCCCPHKSVSDASRKLKELTVLSQPHKSDPIIIGNFLFHKWVDVMTYFWFCSKFCSFKKRNSFKPLFSHWKVVDKGISYNETI